MTPHGDRQLQPRATATKENARRTLTKELRGVLAFKTSSARL